MKFPWLKKAFQWAFLAAYVGACAFILVESAIDGEGSSEQSNAIASRVEDLFNRNYDRKEVKELNDFSLAFDKDPSDAVFHTGDVLRYTCSFSPSDASDQSLRWEIKKGDEVISIDEANQQIRFLSYGEAELAVTSIKKPELSKNISFLSEKIPVERVEVSELEISLIAGDAHAYLIQANVFPENADEKGLKFVSSNPDVIQVDENEGSLKAREEGEALIAISSIDDPSVCASVRVTSSSSRKIALELRDLSLISEEVVLNQNVPSALVTGAYSDAGSYFDPSKIDVSLGEFSSFVTVSEKKAPSPGKFSFRLSLNDPSLAEKEGFADLFGKIKVIYEDLPKNEMSFSLVINHLKTITADLIDAPKISKGIACHYVHLTAMDAFYIEPLAITIPFKQGFRPSDYKQDGFFLFDDSRFDVSFNSYSSLKAVPRYEYEGLAGEVFYVVGETKLLTFRYSYSKIEDPTCTQLDFGLSEFKESEKTAFLVGDSYDDSDFDGLFETYVSSDSKNPDVSEALSKASLSFSSSDSSVLSIESLSWPKKLTFLKKGEAKLIVSFLAKSKEYSLEGVSSPNDYALKLDGEDLFGSDLTLGRGETKTIWAEGLLATSLKEGKISRPLACSIRGSVKESDKDFVAIQNDANGSCFSLKGIKESDDPIPLEIDILSMGLSLGPLVKNVFVTYCPVTSLKLNAALLSAPNEYNSPNADCSIVALGTKLKGQVSTNEGASNQRVTYSSSQERVLKVNPSTGLIEAVGVGTAEIKAVSQDDMDVSSTKKIRVIDSLSPFELDLTKMSAPSASMDEDGSYRICLNYGAPYRLHLNKKVPCSATALACTYGNASQKHIVRVDSGGLVSSMGVGEETVEIGYRTELASYFVKVTFEVKRNLGFTLEQLALFVRKGIGHFSLFAFTALLSLGFIFLAFSKASRRYIGLAASSLLGFLVAMGSEFIQLFTAGRYGAWSDVGIDTAGYMTSILLAAAILGIVSLVAFFREKRKGEEAPSKEEKAK